MVKEQGQTIDEPLANYSDPMHTMNSPLSIHAHKLLEYFNETKPHKKAASGRTWSGIHSFVH